MVDSNLAASAALVDQLQQALGRQDRARIVDCVRQLVAAEAPMGTQWQQVAYIAADQAELTLSRQAMQLYVESAGNDPVALYQQAGLIAQGGTVADAYELLSALPVNVPDTAVNAYSRGAAALFLGKSAEARELLERALELRPDLGQAWLPLSTLVNFAGEPEMAERILSAGAGMERAAPQAQAPYLYALGKAHADRGEHAKAFDAFRQGGLLCKSLRAYDRARDVQSAQAAIGGYDEATVSAMAGLQREPTGRTIFVTGLPRSGSTLVEQILTSHSAVSDGGEINRLRILAQEVGGTTGAHVGAYAAEHGTAEVAKLWSHWMDERFPASRRVVDKSMDTSRFLGLAATILPDAPLIWIRRDPLDCAWSCFRTHFLAGVEWSHDLEDIAFHFRLEEQLFQRWQDILGDRLLVVSYEALVTQPDAEIRRILRHYGLEEEPQVFAPHENGRTVMTSSVMQVRRPINRDGLGVAAPYREFLAPFIDAFAA